MALNTATDISINLCTTREAMQDHVEAWQALMPHVAEDNINYAPAPFFALLDANGAEGVCVAFIWREGILIGVWPLQFGKAYHTPIQQISTYYDSSHMMSSVPLLYGVLMLAPVLVLVIHARRHASRRLLPA